MIEYIEHHIVDHCNLNCASCTHFSPLADPWFETIEQFEKDFSELARRTNVRKIRILGGEPLLHPQVGQFLTLTRELFPESEIQLVTNGVLLAQRKEELMPICNSSHIIVFVTDYKLGFNLQEVLDGFWKVIVDPRLEMYNPSLDLTGAQDIDKVFYDCEYYKFKCYYYQNGRFYLCSICANIHYFNKFFNKQIGTEEELEQMSISIYDHSIDEIKNFLSHPIAMCRYCNIDKRFKSFHDFYRSKKEISEWTYQ